LTAAEKTLLSSRIAKHEPNQHGGSLLSAIRIPGFLMLGFIYFLIQVASYGLNFWAPQLIRSAGTQSPVMIGLLTAIPYVCGAIDAHWLTAAEKTLLSSRIAQHEPNKHGGSLLSAIRIPGFLMLGFIYFLIQVASYGLNFWAPQLIRSAGTQSPVMIGLLTAIPYVCGAISMVVIGRLSDATGERRKFVCGLVVLGAVGFFSAGIFADHTTFLIIALGMLGAGIIASIPTFWTLPPKLLAGAGAGAAGGIAVINTLGQFGGIVSPVMVGRIKDLTGSTTPALYVIGVCALLAAALLLWGLPQKLRTLDKA